MNCSPLASSYIAQIRNRFRPHIESGIELTPEQVYWLVSNLNTAHALAIEQEDNLTIFEREAKRRPIDVPTLGGNVLRLPLKHRVSIVTSDGGDAA